MSISKTKLPNQFHQSRNFIAARVKWVPDPYLDTAVSKEKNLQQVLSLKNQILSSPSKSLPLSSLSLLKPSFNLPTTATNFFLKYPSLFTLYQPFPSRPIHVKLTHHAFRVHNEEKAVFDSLGFRVDVVKRLARVLMLTGVKRLPLYVVDRFRFDLGLPHDYVRSVLCDFPEYFDVVVCDGGLCLELVKWRDELAVSEMERRSGDGELGCIKKGARIAFPLSFPRGFDLEKRVRDWVFEWQGLPYVSPYENAFHLNPYGDQAEKWTVAVLHELLWLLVSKKTERDNLFCLGEYLGFGDRFKKALRHHPGIFYVSNKIRTQTVVLREAYKKDFLIQKHPLMSMRYRYVHLMNKGKRMRERMASGANSSYSKKISSVSAGGSEDRKTIDEFEAVRERKLNDSYDSELDVAKLSGFEYKTSENDEELKIEDDDFA